MVSQRLRPIVASLLLCLFATAAKAQAVSELRVGLTDHTELDVALFLPLADTIDPGNVDSISFEVLFASPHIDAFKWLGSPRPRIGGRLDPNGQANMLNAGLNWQFPILQSRVFAEATLGLAVHDGTLHGATPPDRNLGCPVLAYVAYGLGYQFNERWNVVLGHEHASHYNVCGPDNMGLNGLTLRVGYKFN